MLHKNIFLLTGSNLGNRSAQLELSIEEIKKKVGRIVKQSGVYETSAWGKTDQSQFLNQALQIETTLSPQRLLEKCLAIEKSLGRTRSEKWGARTIDIDIIYFGNEIIQTAELVIPHPRMAERKFVLIPLTEISVAFIHPLLKKTNQELKNECTDLLEVTRFTN